MSSFERGTFPIGERIRSHLRDKTSNQIKASRMELETQLEDVKPEDLYTIVERWADDWKRFGLKQKQESSPQNNEEQMRPLPPSEMVAKITAKQQDSTTPMPVLLKVIDGIVAAAKVQRNITGFADLAATACLGPMTTHCRFSHQDMELHIHSFNKVMNLYCREKKVRLAEQLLNMLEDTLDKVSQRDDTSARYNLVSSGTYAILIGGYSNCGMPREAEHVLFARMIQQRKLMPRKELFDSCLAAWEIAGTKDAGHRAEFLLLRHQQWHEAHPDVVAPPDAHTLAKAVNAWVNSKHPDAPTHIGKILDTMYAVEFSDVNIFASVHLQEMKIWAWRGNPDQCRDSLQRLMKQFGKNRIPPLKLQRMYATWITAHVRSRNIRQKQVKRILDSLEVERKQGTFGDVNFWHRSLYLAMFEGMAKVGDGVGSEELLNQLLGHNDAPQPNLKVYNCVLLAWSKTKDSDAVERAELLFHRMIQQRLATPDVVTYNAILAAMARTQKKTSSLALRGETYLRQMRNDGVNPTTVTYNQAIQLWWRIPGRDALTRVDVLLDEMAAFGIVPDASTLKACLSVVEASGLPSEEQQRLCQWYRSKLSRGGNG